MREELQNDALKPLSATTVFCSPVPHGPMEIRVHILRKSGGAAQVRAALTSTVAPGPGLEVIATFARDRGGLEFLDVDMPKVPSPQDSEPYFNRRQPDARASFLQQIEMRLAMGHRWFEKDWSAGPAHFARWIRYHESQLEDGVLDPLALPPLIDFMPPALDEHQGPMPLDKLVFAPSLDLTVYFLEEIKTEWMLIYARCRSARLGYATGDIEIWTEDGRLAAVGSQMMILRKHPGKPGAPKPD
jgi:acyl-CoA thioesterase